jgi:hypothetical protein
MSVHDIKAIVVNIRIYVITKDTNSIRGTNIRRQLSDIIYTECRCRFVTCAVIMAVQMGEMSRND